MRSPTLSGFAGYCTDRGKWQDIRSSIHRAAKNSVTAQWISYRHAPLAITEQIAAISEEWVAVKGLARNGVHPWRLGRTC